MKAAYDQCQKVAKNEARCALLYGSFGNGKTHLAIATFWAWNANRVQPVGWFWKVPDFLARIKARAFDGDETVDQVIASYQFGTSLIVFDDLGAENATDWASEQLYRVLDARYDSGAPTVITSNKTAAQLDGRILDRYRAGMVVCKGRSLRDE